MEEEQVACSMNINIWNPGEDLNISMQTKEEETIKAATLNALIIYLTNNDMKDKSKIISVLLLSFRSFTSAENLLLKLLERYRVPKDIAQPTKKIIEVQVLSFIRVWITLYMDDFIPPVLQILDKFVKERGDENIVNAINESFRQNKKPIQLERNNKRVPKWISINPFLMEIPAIEIAKQITLNQYEIYCRITARELYLYSKDKINIPHLRAFIDHFNYICIWICYTILQEDNIEQRVRVYTKFVEIGSAFLALRNFQGLFAVLSALNSASIHRLKNTKALVPKKVHKEFTNLSRRMQPASGYRRLRNFLDAAESPCILYMGLYLTDLTFIEEGCRKWMDGNILFDKFNLAFKVINTVRNSMNAKYEFSSDIFIQKFLKGKALVTDVELFTISTTLEPRECTTKG